jgi:hypothetical protein
VWTAPLCLALGNVVQASGSVSPHGVFRAPEGTGEWCTRRTKCVEHVVDVVYQRISVLM